jgi:hypothetical protein
VALDRTPVVAITEVQIDGAPVDPARYRVDNHRLLVWQNPEGSGGPRGWPCCQRFDRPDGDPGTWLVEYTYGRTPPVGGQRAAAALACQYALGCSTDPDLAGQCVLPAGTVSVVRQGTTKTMAPAELIQMGLTGLRQADDWVSSDNKGWQQRQAGVFVPGRRHMRPRHVTAVADT